MFEKLVEALSRLSAWLIILLMLLFLTATAFGVLTLVELAKFMGFPPPIEAVGGVIMVAIVTMVPLGAVYILSRALLERGKRWVSGRAH